MVEIGKLDRVTVVIGERGMGKSTYLKLDARAFRQETGGYVIGHSTNGQIGDAKDIVFHDSVDSLPSKWRGLGRWPERIHIVTKGAPEDVLEYGEALAASIRKRAFKRQHGELRRWRADRPAPPGTMAPPVLVMIDEGIAMKRHPSQDELAELERQLTSARHSHLAITWSSQAPTARQWTLLEQASSLRVFRYHHEYGANALRAAGIQKEIIPILRDLPPFAYYSFDKRHPELAKIRVLPKP